MSKDCGWTLGTLVCIKAESHAARLTCVIPPVQSHFLWWHSLHTGSKGTCYGFPQHFKMSIILQPFGRFLLERPFQQWEREGGDCCKK